MYIYKKKKEKSQTKQNASCCDGKGHKNLFPNTREVDDGEE